jgi:large subunit ribosomal protein L22
MEIISVSKSVRVAPRKIRLVADSIRKLSIEEALRSLSILKNRGSYSLEKTLKSAIANAVNNNKLKQEALIIKSIDVLEAPSYKRFRPSTRGRVHPYKRRGTHIKITLEEKNVAEVKVNKEEKK